MSLTSSKFQRILAAESERLIHDFACPQDPKGYYLLLKEKTNFPPSPLLLVDSTQNTSVTRCMEVFPSHQEILLWISTRYPIIQFNSKIIYMEMVT
jgi:hypothetical protein